MKVHKWNLAYKISRSKDLARLATDHTKRLVVNEPEKEN